jgi:hypothetical protein
MGGSVVDVSGTEPRVVGGRVNAIADLLVSFPEDG